MGRAISTSFAVAALLAVMAPANQAVAMTPATPSGLSAATQDAHDVRTVDFVCNWKCARRWPPRQYWHWDQRPAWDDPWTVLRPTIWGSPEPYVVPADHWAHEWHPPGSHHWHRRDPH
jgi:hypothetical protein